MEIDPGYVGFDLDALYKMATTIFYNIGTGFTMLIVVLLFVIAIYLIVHTASRFIR